jgi:hypothetical protein
MARNWQTVRDFITGKYARRMQRMAHKVALSRARESRPKTVTVHLRGDWE